MYWPYSTPAVLAAADDAPGSLPADHVVFDRRAELMLTLGPDRLVLYSTKARPARP